MSRRPAPLRLGGDRVLVRLKSGEYVCVDANSIDATDYLLGWPIEADYLAVFRRFLRPDSVVLDIGANFGLYTAVAGRMLGRQGRLWAFEGNPHTWRLLLRTLYANRLLDRPNIVPVNMLVSRESGRGTLYFTEEALGGATMSKVEGWPVERRSVEVSMKTIDDFLPADLAVDLVKIDVEGHEPFVLQGMERTIRRSPSIRLLIEYAEPLLSLTMTPAEFREWIAAIGLHVCEVRRHGRLDPLPPGAAPSGSHCWLLTRTPEADRDLLERWRRRLPVRLKRWAEGAAAAWNGWRDAWRRL